MRAFRLAIITFAAALVVPAAASAKVVQLGAMPASVKPSCPKPCLAISRTTGFQARSGDTRGGFVAQRDGKIVAWTIRLGSPGAKQRAYFDKMLGGPAAAQITVLRPGTHRRYRVVGHGPVTPLEDYFGHTVQFPLDRSLTVHKGYVVALTVPTWAPALAVGLPKTWAWRASRGRGDCKDTQTQTAQLDRLDLAQYRCGYRTARITYSALMITTPHPPRSRKASHHRRHRHHRRHHRRSR